MRALPARRIAYGALCAALLAGTTGPAAMAAEPDSANDRAAAPAPLLTQVGHVHAHGSQLAPVVALVNAVREAEDGRLSPDRARTLGEAARAAVARAADDDDPATAPTPTTATSPAPAATPSAPTPAVTAPAPVTAPETGVLLLPTPNEPAAGSTNGTDTLGAVREALDGLLDVLVPKGSTTTTEQTADGPTDAPADETTAGTSDGTTGETTAGTSDETTDEAAAGTTGASTGAESASADTLMARVDALIAALTGADPQVSTLPAPALPAPAADAPAADAPSASAAPAMLPALTSLLLPTS